MTSNELVFLLDGIAVGFNAALVVHYGGKIWDDFQDRRAIRRHTKRLDEREALTVEVPK